MMENSFRVKIINTQTDPVYKDQVRVELTVIQISPPDYGDYPPVGGSALYCDKLHLFKPLSEAKEYYVGREFTLKIA